MKATKSKELSYHKLKFPLIYNKKIVQKYGDARVYRDAVLLTPGTWTDAVSMSPIEYTSEELQKSAKVWESNYLNIDHSWKTLDRIGYVRDTYFSNNSVKGDLYIYPITQNSKDAIALIDAGLINALSVELYSRDVWSNKSESRLATDITFCGLAVVTDPACKDARIK